MTHSAPPSLLGRWIRSLVLLGVVGGAAVGLAAWKRDSMAAADAAARSQPEPVEVVAAATVEPQQHVRTTTAIGTVRALRSITLQNELPGTVEEVNLDAGRLVQAGDVLVALDVSVEKAELRALEAQAKLAETLHGRMERALASQGASAVDVDRASAEVAVAHANVERVRALIERKRIRAPFAARIGLSDVHPGQYLEVGTRLTTLQGVDESAHVDFTVAQDVAAGLRVGQRVAIEGVDRAARYDAELVAIDARVDPATRNVTLRARIDCDGEPPAPGASLRVRVPIGESQQVAVVPVSALRKGPGGDHVFAIVEDEHGVTRAQMRRVTSGPVLGDLVAVLEGVQPGERVAASGSFKLFDGVRVAIAEAQDAAR